MTNENGLHPNAGPPAQTEKLLRSYLAAFANFYGILPLYRALRIIQTQNPELELTEEDFLAFADKVDQEEDHFYIIAGQEEIYDNVKEPTPPLKREIIAEHLYAVDDFESYDEMKADQSGKPYYIPEKEELLKYEDDCYFEYTKEALALRAFLRDKLKLKRADAVLDDLQLEARLGYSTPQDAFETIQRLTGRPWIGTSEQTNEFFKYYYDMCNNTRLAFNRGFTPNELHERMDGPPQSIQFGPNISHALQTGEMDIQSLRRDIAGADIPLPLKANLLNNLNQVKQKKPGRNDPCPCGSGKKYKRCCGR